MTRYECKECCDDYLTKPCVVIIPGDKMWSCWHRLVTPNSKKAYFKVVEETI